MNGARNIKIFFGPAPWGPREGPKGQISFNFNYKVNFKDFFFGPAPWGPGGGQKVKYHLISITKSISKIFIPNLVCVLANERYKTYQRGFSLCSLGHAPGV